MNPEAEPFINMFHNVHQDIIDQLKGLPPEALNWKPIPQDVNSLCVLIHHVCGSEIWWVHGVLGKRKVQRSRDAEFITEAKDVRELISLMEQTDVTTRQVLEALPANSLTSPVEPPPADELQRAMGAYLTQPQAARPVRSVLAQLLGSFHHLTMHLGHIQLTRQLWDQKAKA